jgi:RimJ/RimL family protein N-acetyltransferase
LCYEFYYKSADQRSNHAVLKLPAGLTAHFWHPSLLNFKPRGASFSIFFVWWLFHFGRIFANRDYSLFLIYQKQQLVHRSCIFPRYFRFPFMSKEDLQIGDIWTHPDYRNTGLAHFAIQNILHSYEKLGRLIWYVVAKDNIASIKVINKAGFIKVGEGVRTKRFGLNILGGFFIKQND